MSSSSVSENYQASEQLTTEPDLLALNAKILAVDDGCDEVDKSTDKLIALQQAIYEYKMNHVAKTGRVKERLIDMSRESTITGKSLVNSCDEHLKAITKATAPYANSARAEVTSDTPIIDGCIKVLATIKGIDAAIRTTDELSANIMKHHQMLGRVEEKQNNTMTRYETALRIEQIRRQHPSGDPLYFLANLPALLMSVHHSYEVTDHYKTLLKAIGERILALLTDISLASKSKESTVYNSNDRFMSSLSTLSSLSNGEIDLKSIKDPTEHPLDAPINPN